MIPASLVPKNGDASTKTESTIAKIPTPIRNARDMRQNAYLRTLLLFLRYH